MAEIESFSQGDRQPINKQYRILKIDSFVLRYRDHEVT